MFWIVFNSVVSILILATSFYFIPLSWLLVPICVTFYFLGAFTMYIIEYIRSEEN